MEPSSPSLRPALLRNRRVVAAALVALLLIVVAGTAGMVLLAPSAKATTPPGSPLAGASATATPTASLESASPSVSASPSASATATAAPHGPGTTPRPTTIHLSGTFSFDASRPYSGIIVYPADRLEMWATGTYYVRTPPAKGSGMTPAGVGCTGGNSNTGFLAPSLTKFAVIFWYDNPSQSASYCLAGHATFNASVEAVLKFAVNDNQYGDNSGTITINWEIDRQP